MSRIETPSRATLTLSLAALGIVFGDLGTSPLYALQEAFHGDRGVAPSPENVIGCLSLFLWSLIIMVSLKYVLLLMRADNQGEGGILALLALLVGDVSRNSRSPARGRPQGALWISLAMVGVPQLPSKQAAEVTTVTQNIDSLPWDTSMPKGGITTSLGTGAIMLSSAIRPNAP